MMAIVIFALSVTVCEIAKFILRKWPRFESLSFKQIGHRICRWVVFFCGLQYGEKWRIYLDPFSIDPQMHTHGHTHSDDSNRRECNSLIPALYRKPNVDPVVQNFSCMRIHSLNIAFRLAGNTSYECRTPPPPKFPRTSPPRTLATPSRAFVKLGHTFAPPSRGQMKCPILHIIFWCYFRLSFFNVLYIYIYVYIYMYIYIYIYIYFSVLLHTL